MPDNTSYRAEININNFKRLGPLSGLYTQQYVGRRLKEKVPLLSVSSSVKRWRGVALIQKRYQIWAAVGESWAWIYVVESEFRDI